MSGKQISALAWIIIGLAAAITEAAGVTGFDGAWPLTWFVRDLMNAFWPLTLAMIVGWVWLGFHFFQERRTHH